MKSVVRDCIFVTAIASLLFYSSLGASHLWDRDEPRNAGCAAEMMAANDWVVPVFNSELRTHKPILLYWFMMTAYGGCMAGASVGCMNRRVSLTWEIPAPGRAY